MRILVTPTFDRTVKKLHQQQKSTLDCVFRSSVTSDSGIVTR